EDRVAGVGGERLCGVEVGDLRAGYERQPGGGRRGAGAELVAGERNDLPWRADERDPLLARQRREARILREEAIAGVDRVAAGAQGGLDDRLGPQVAVGRARRADADGAVGEARGGAVAVDIRDSGDGLEPERAAGPDDAHRDLP